ncbi:MAG TPA: MopE-related protein [Candidatus Polarisedimenticolia bacterium]|nr:MopE-related protein [Candidatus Polarisedimenticolia bacterium]
MPQSGSVWSRAQLSLSMVLWVAAGAARADAATLLDYQDEAAFRAAVVTPHTLENWDSFPAGRRITDQIPGVTISSPNSGLRNFIPIQVMTTGGAKSVPNVLGGGFARSTTKPPQAIVLEFAPTTAAFSFYLTDQDPAATNVTVRFELAGQTFVTRSVVNPHPSQAAPIFFGATSDTPIVRVTLTAGFKNGGQGGYEEFTIDNLFFGRSCPLDVTPPVCTGHPVEQGSTVVIAGTATDDQACDSGIASVALRPGGTNVSVSLDPAFQTGDPVAGFTAAQTDFSLDGQATVIATDGAGNTCALPVCFHALPGGPVVDQVVCCGDGFLLQVTNENNLPAGTAACSATLPGPSEPPFPPGYEPSPPEDPFPCRVLTIESPISGLTEMVYKKDAAFEPRLRLLFSRSTDGGLTFPPFTDVTTSVEPILTIVPDPTRVGGSVAWSPVKVACAIQGVVDCSSIDPTFDFDQDGYPLCPAAGSGILADCNDQIPTIHPGAAEICNGMDDDCDGLVDDGNPGGGQACQVAGGLGACATGTTACFEGHLVCNPSSEPTGEVCDGVDNDCDGAVDEGLGTITCGSGACVRTISACIGGIPQVCVPVEPGPEICNGVDDDCDGLIDEAYVFSGFGQPVEDDGSGVFHRRQVIPFKFSIRNCAGANVAGAFATIEVFFYRDGVVGNKVKDVTSPGQANTDNIYRYDAAGRQYIYNLGTLSLSINTSYVVRTRIDDGSVHDVIISIIK